MPNQTGTNRDSTLDQCITGSADLLSNSHSNSSCVSIVNHQVNRKSTRLNSSHTVISYAVFCLKKKKKKKKNYRLKEGAAKQHRHHPLILETDYTVDGRDDPEPVSAQCVIVQGYVHDFLLRALH